MISTAIMLVPVGGLTAFGIWATGGFDHSTRNAQKLQNCDTAISSLATTFKDGTQQPIRNKKPGTTGMQMTLDDGTKCTLEIK